MGAWLGCHVVLFASTWAADTMVCGQIHHLKGGKRRWTYLLRRNWCYRFRVLPLFLLPPSSMPNPSHTSQSFYTSLLFRSSRCCVHLLLLLLSSPVAVICSHPLQAFAPGVCWLLCQMENEVIDAPLLQETGWQAGSAKETSWHTATAKDTSWPAGAHRSWLIVVFIILIPMSLSPSCHCLLLQLVIIARYNQHHIPIHVSPLFVDCCVKLSLRLLRCRCSHFLLQLCWGEQEGIESSSLSGVKSSLFSVTLPPPKQNIKGQRRVAEVPQLPPSLQWWLAAMPAYSGGVWGSNGFGGHCWLKSWWGTIVLETGCYVLYSDRGHIYTTSVNVNAMASPPGCSMPKHRACETRDGSYLARGGGRGRGGYGEGRNGGSVSWLLFTPDWKNKELKILVGEDIFITFTIFVCWQLFIARIVCELLSSDCGISHFYMACYIDKLSRGFILGYEILINN